MTKEAVDPSRLASAEAGVVVAAAAGSLLIYAFVSGGGVERMTLPVGRMAAVDQEQVCWAASAEAKEQCLSVCVCVCLLSPFIWFARPFNTCPRPFVSNLDFTFAH